MENNEEENENGELEVEVTWTPLGSILKFALVVFKKAPK